IGIDEPRKAFAGGQASLGMLPFTSGGAAPLAQLRFVVAESLGELRKRKCGHARSLGASRKIARLLLLLSCAAAGLPSRVLPGGFIAQLDKSAAALGPVVAAMP